MDFGQYRQPTTYESLFRYIAPDGYHWFVGDTDYGSIIYGENILQNPYDLRKVL